MGRNCTLWAEAAGLAWALGMALYTSTYFALYLCGVKGTTATWASMALTLGGIVLGLRRLMGARRQDMMPANSGPRGAIVVGAGVAALQVGYAAWLAVRVPLGSWDAWSFWALKGRMFAIGGPHAGYFHDTVTVYTHPDYPLNLSLAEAALFRLPGPLGVHLAGLIGPACFAALLLLYGAGLGRLYGRAVAALAVAVLALVPALVIQAAGGDADVPLALYAGGATLYLLLWWRLRRPADAVLMALLCGGAIWTKREGLVAAALVLLAYAVGEMSPRGAPARERVWSAVRVVLLAVALPLPWLLFSHLTHPIGVDFLPFTPAEFLAHAGRIPPITLRLVLETLIVDNWGFLWLALAGALVLRRRRLSPCARRLLLLLVGQLGVYGGIFIFSAWQPYTLHIQASLDRLYVQVVPAVVVVLIEVVCGPRTGRRIDTRTATAPGLSGRAA
jgi:hypothetical protein